MMLKAIQYLVLAHLSTPVTLRPPTSVTDSHVSLPAAPQAPGTPPPLLPALCPGLCVVCSTAQIPAHLLETYCGYHLAIYTNPDSLMLYTQNQCNTVCQFYLNREKRRVDGHAVTILVGLIFLRHTRADLIPFKQVTLTSRLEICKCNLF